MKKWFISIIMLAGLSSCSSNNNDLFTENNIIVTHFEKEKQLVARVLIDDVYGYYNIGHIDEYLVLFSVQHERFFYVYSITGDSLGSFGVKGQGPTDLVNNDWCGQTYGKSMWINDINRARMCAVNVEQSLAQKQCVFDTAIRTAGFSVNSFVLNDSIILSEQMRGDNYYLLTININTEATKEEKLYNYPTEHVFGTYNSKWRIKPDCSKMASAMHSINMINILDVKTKKRKSIITGNQNINLGNIVNKETALANRMYYITLDVTDNYIYALYRNESFGIEIHVFDWQGTPVYRYIVPEYTWTIAVDENNRCIYSWSQELEKVYVYEMDN
ncbi:MAG: TolB-like 6-bladed beta-propeller domain-containing protein [Prevotellaceae bacterium]|nr:TolB-like 6-bladed beta-propeller domain-containing protein [Prevotellaceae bacterium]